MTLEDKTFKNYNELANYLQIPNTRGKFKKLKIKALSEQYEISYEGQKIIFGKMKREHFINEELEAQQERYQNELNILKSNSLKNYKYISNNLLLFIYYMQKNDNEYITYNTQQMKEFGFLSKQLIQKDIMEEDRDFPFIIPHDFEQELQKDIQSTPIKKNPKDFLKEVYNALRDRYARLMDMSCSKFLSEKSVVDFSEWLTKAQWSFFSKRFNESINFINREMDMIGIKVIDGVKIETPLTRKEITQYFIIRNEVLYETQAPEMRYEDMRKQQNEIFKEINRRCEESLGYKITYRKVYYSPLKDLTFFNITSEDAEKAMADNNQKIKQTLEKSFKNKCVNIFNNKIQNIYTKCINFILGK